MNDSENKESLAGIHQELARLNNNIEKIIHKIDTAIDKDRNSLSYDEWKIESDKRNKKTEIWTFMVIAIGIAGLLIYDNFIK